MRLRWVCAVCVMAAVGTVACTPTGPDGGATTSTSTVPVTATSTVPATTTSTSTVPVTTTSTVPATTTSTVAAPTLVAIDTTVVEFLRVGEVGGVGDVELSAPAVVDTFVAVRASDPTCLAISGGGATVPAGKTHASVEATGLKACPSVTLTATLGTVSVQGTTVVEPAS